MGTVRGPEALAASLADVFEKKLKLKGDGLEAKLAGGGAKLPEWVQAEAGAIAEAAALAHHPKLWMRVDEGALEAGYKRCVRWAKGVDLKAERRGKVLDWAAGTAFNLLIVIAAFIGYLVWSGHV
ncbi:hypothetical protein [Pseudoruegeria sp. HB172150]|uniref:hypothetical protein n=1 Tax=Pseudoruegeria sp. HB172150 TaxID=2721164 RepID=UPI00155777AA|nr:hypothetical protein [Pseudoruegeria sp. HB172150]